MIVVKLMDGLGNQMFQYAFGRYLQEVYNEPIVFETTKLNSKSLRKVGIQHLNIGDGQIKPWRMAGRIESLVLRNYSKGIRLLMARRFKLRGDEGYTRMIKYGFYTTEDPIQYHPFQKTKLPIKFVRGYFQSEKYFAPVKDIIKKEFMVKDEPDSEQKSIISDICKQQSVAIHIRRGDYVNNKRFDVCTENYYMRAVKKMNELLEDPVYYVFSNSISDLEWIRKNYHLPAENIVYMDKGSSEVDDLRFMYNCHYHIISNSTFSWWGSYLCVHEGNMTIAPDHWYNDMADYRDIYRKEWIICETYDF